MGQGVGGINGTADQEGKAEDGGWAPGRRSTPGVLEYTFRMTVIDDFLTTVEPSKRQALERIRTLAKQAVPGAEEAIVYRMPTLTSQGKPFLGFDAHKGHIGIYPYSGQVVEEVLKDLPPDYGHSKGAIRIPLDHPIAEELLKHIIHLRLKQITPPGR